MSQLQVSRHLRPADVQVPVLQARGLVGRHVVFDLERRSLGFRDHLELLDIHLYFASRELRVLSSRRPAPHRAASADHIFVAHVRSHRFGSNDDLHDSPSIAKIEERDAAVVAPTRDPAVELDLLAGVRRAKRSAMRGGESAHLKGVPANSRRRRSEEHTSELQSRSDLVCRLLLEKKKKKKKRKKKNEKKKKEKKK